MSTSTSKQQKQAEAAEKKAEQEAVKAAQKDETLKNYKELVGASQMGTGDRPEWASEMVLVDFILMGTSLYAGFDPESRRAAYLRKFKGSTFQLMIATVFVLALGPHFETNMNKMTPAAKKMWERVKAATGVSATKPPKKDQSVNFVTWLPACFPEIVMVAFKLFPEMTETYGTSLEPMYCFSTGAAMVSEGDYQEWVKWSEARTRALSPGKDEAEIAKRVAMSLKIGASARAHSFYRSKRTEFINNAESAKLGEAVTALIYHVTGTTGWTEEAFSRAIGV